MGHVERTLAEALERSDSSLSRPRLSNAPLTDEPCELGPGMQVGRYAILERVGAGSMGVVHAAYDPELDRKVALKLLHAQRQSESGRARLLREAQALARLGHPNVTTVHDVGEFAGQIYIVMEFVEGLTLRAWLATPRSWRAILDVFSQAGQGLAAAHAAGLVHRDFKPANVMVGRDGRTRVTDFGLARALSSSGRPPGAEQFSRPPAAEQTRLSSLAPTESSSPNAEPSSSRARGLDKLRTTGSSDALASEITRAGSLLGTPAYMAPEQFLGRPADPRSDQFSFCIALFEALHGVRPFVGETVDELLGAMHSGELRSSSSRVPKWVRAVLQRGLAVDPAMRWPDLGALLERLRPVPLARRPGLVITALSVALALGFGAHAIGSLGEPAVRLVGVDAADEPGSPTSIEHVRELESSYFGALASGEQRAAIDAALALAFVYARDLGDSTQAHTWLRHADALVRASGDDPDLRARVDRELASVLGREG